VLFAINRQSKRRRSVNWVTQLSSKRNGNTNWKTDHTSQSHVLSPSWLENIDEIDLKINPQERNKAGKILSWWLKFSSH
jgi:hypothetical protein